MGERVAGGAVRACEWGHGGGHLGYCGGHCGRVVYDCVDCGDGFYVCAVTFSFLFSYPLLRVGWWGEECRFDGR